MDFVEVIKMSGRMMKGRTNERATCDATSMVSIPLRPAAVATTTDGTRPMRRVKKRRNTGYGLSQIYAQG